MAPIGPSQPAIAIVTATYNRSRALACAIESARRQSFADWEMIVVGDACTDDTAEVVERIGDPRIRFTNLEQNCGEQAGPNNVGVAETTAPLVAFLNHDDLWLPNHLKLCREALLAQQADLVFGVMANVQPDTPLPLRFETLRLVLEGAFEANRYSPGELDAGVVPASSWLVRREVLQRLGGWKLARDCYVEPSQDLLFRAWRAGYRLRAVNLVTTLVVASGCRPGSYLHGQALEQEWFLERLGEPGLAAELAARGVASCSAELHLRPPWWMRQMAMGVALAGLNPREIDFRFRRKLHRGERIAGFRKIRGLGAAAPGLRDAGANLRFETVRRSCRVEIGATIDFAAGRGGARHLAAGWSRPEEHGVWSDGPEAILLFDFGAPLKRDLLFEFSLRPFLGSGTASQTVTVASGIEQQLDVWNLSDKDDSRQLLFPATARRGTLAQIQFQFASPTSPRSLGLSDDARQLAIWLVRIHITEAPRGLHSA